MANVKVTPENIVAKITQWANGQNITDTLIFQPSDGLDEKEVINKAWKQANIVVTITTYQNEFRKIAFIEKL